MSDEIRVVIIEAGNPTIKIVENFDHSLENLQTFVGGYIEAVRVDESITIWINEEGKLQGLQPNFNLVANGKPYDYICGDALIAGTDEEGDTISLTDDELEKLQELFIDRVNFKMF